MDNVDLVLTVKVLAITDKLESEAMVNVDSVRIEMLVDMAESMMLVTSMIYNRATDTDLMITCNHQVMVSIIRGAYHLVKDKEN